MAENLPQLLMRRPDLTGLPPLGVPEGFSLRSFRDGDQAGWNRVMDLAFEREPGHSDYDQEMAADPVYLPERVKLAVTDAGDVVATASAWESARHGLEHGMLHWVAVHPEYAGQRLGLWVSVAALQYSAREGRRAGLLLTDDFRTGALKTYLRLGFHPLCNHQSHPDRWRLILSRLGMSGQYEECISGPLVSLG